MINSDYKISDENKELFTSVCEKYSGGLRIFDVCYGEVTDKIRSQSYVTDDSQSLESVSASSIDEMSLAVEIQKKFLTSEAEQAQLGKSLTRIQSQSILRNEKLVVDDNIFHEYLNKSSSMNSGAFIIFAKIILLPKLASTNGLVSEAVGNVLSELFITHQDDIINEILVPLLSSEGQSDYGVSHLLQQLLTKEVPTSNLVKLIGALSVKPSIDEKDLKSFTLIFECTNATDGKTQNAVLEFLSKYSNDFAKSIKFGLCILAVLQKMGKSVSTKDSLAFLVASHKSSMRKTIELHFKRME